MRNSKLRRLFVVSAFLGVLVAAGCSGESRDLELKVGNWGPQSKVVGEIPNRQPKGEIGLWIQVTGKKKVEYDVIFDGKPLGIVGGDTDLITAAIPVELTEAVGAKDIYIQEIVTGKRFFVGKFVTNPAEAKK